MAASLRPPPPQICHHSSSKFHIRRKNTTACVSSAFSPSPKSLRSTVSAVSAAPMETNRKSPVAAAAAAASTPSNEQLQSEGKQGSTVAEQKTVIINSSGEKLVGVLQKSESEDIVILCHGFRCSRESRTIKGVGDKLLEEGISVFRFDFSGNGESEGSFQFGNYWKEVGDLRAVALYLIDKKYQIRAIAGHSKGGNVVLLYASIYHDIPKVVNISGRFDVRRGIEERLGKDCLKRIKMDGFIDVRDKMGCVAYRVTEESLMERLAIDMHAACLKVDKNSRTLTVHGSSDEIIPVEDAQEIDKLIANHKLHIIEGADHGYTSHLLELASTVLDFLR